MRCLHNPVNCQMWFFYLASTFIVFRERDITSENHGTPVHLHIIVHTLNLLSVFTFKVPLLSLALILCKRQGRRNWQLLCTRWEQSYLFLCAGPRQLPSQEMNFRRRCHLLVSLWVLLETNLGIFTEGNLLLSTSNIPLGVTNEESCHSVSSEFLAPLPGTQGATSRRKVNCGCEQ